MRVVPHASSSSLKPVSLKPAEPHTFTLDPFVLPKDIPATFNAPNVSDDVSYYVCVESADDDAFTFRKEIHVCSIIAEHQLTATEPQKGENEMLLELGRGSGWCDVCSCSSSSPKVKGRVVVSPPYLVVSERAPPTNLYTTLEFDSSTVSVDRVRVNLVSCEQNITLSRITDGRQWPTIIGTVSTPVKREHESGRLVKVPLRFKVTTRGLRTSMTNMQHYALLVHWERGMGKSTVLVAIAAVCVDVVQFIDRENVVAAFDRGAADNVTKMQGTYKHSTYEGTGSIVPYVKPSHEYTVYPDLFCYTTGPGKFPTLAACEVLPQEPTSPSSMS
eukprot:PhM_4_TR2815/c0_g1_i2/m.94084